jgi:hypothetical protein
MFREAPTEAPFDENLSAARRRKRRTKLGASRPLPWTSVSVTSGAARLSVAIESRHRPVAGRQGSAILD